MELIIVSILTGIIGYFVGRYYTKKDKFKLKLSVIIFAFIYGFHLIYIFIIK